MDISKYIAELLYEHDCVIIPGFGGFVCNYKPAEINSLENTISPPAKAISFNKNLRTNDGLLLNYISSRENLSFDEAFVNVYAWVSSSNALLQKSEEVRVNSVGKFQNNTEGNLQFTPDESVNYLKSSFGLRTITAYPTIHIRSIDSTPRIKPQPKEEIKISRNVWRMAAAIFLIAALVSVLQLMRTGVEIKPLHLDEANVLNAVSTLFKTTEPEMKPIPVEVVSTPVVSEIKQEVAAEPVIETATTVSTSPSSSATYYIVIGAFGEAKNISAAANHLKERFPATAILVEKGTQLTKVAYSAGSDYDNALEQLKVARQENDTYWLLKK
jgi:hypothetical protein